MNGSYEAMTVQTYYLIIFLLFAYINQKNNRSSDLVEVKKHTRRNIYKANFFIRRNFPTAKYPYGEISKGENSLRRNFLREKLSYGKISPQRSFPRRNFPQRNNLPRIECRSTNVE